MISEILTQRKFRTKVMINQNNLENNPKCNAIYIYIHYYEANKYGWNSLDICKHTFHLLDLA
jgi:hypothetical protein